MVEIIDLSTLSPKPVIVKVGNGEEIEEIDLTIVPARGTLLLSEATQRHGGWEKIPDDEMIPAIAAICGQANPKITAEWLETKLTGRSSPGSRRSSSPRRSGGGAIRRTITSRNTAKKTGDRGGPDHRPSVQEFNGWTRGLLPRSPIMAASVDVPRILD